MNTTEVGGVAKKDDDVEIIDEEEDDDEEVGEEVVLLAANQLHNQEKLAEPKQKIRAKLLQFHDNQRPPYWGTW